MHQNYDKYFGLWLKIVMIYKICSEEYTKTIMIYYLRVDVVAEVSSLLLSSTNIVLKHLLLIDDKSINSC